MARSIPFFGIHHAFGVNIPNTFLGKKGEYTVMPPSRRRPPKGKAATVTSRVHKITSEEQWHVMMKRAGTRLVIVQFYGSDMYISRNMRAYFVRLSVQPKFRAAIFAEVNFQEFEVCDPDRVD